MLMLGGINMHTGRPRDALRPPPGLVWGFFSHFFFFLHHFNGFLPNPSGWCLAPPVRCPRCLSFTREPSSSAGNQPPPAGVGLGRGPGVPRLPLPAKVLPCGFSRSRDCGESPGHCRWLGFLRWWHWQSSGLRGGVRVMIRTDRRRMVMMMMMVMIRADRICWAVTPSVWCLQPALSARGSSREFPQRFAQNTLKILEGR